jgi:prepilin-type N-terminal cleavage/methylation domain-containing protein
MPEPRSPRVLPESESAVMKRGFTLMELLVVIGITTEIIVMRDQWPSMRTGCSSS